MPNRIIREGLIASIQATATGDNVVIATQTTSGFICVNWAYVYANTTLANQVGAFQISGTTGSNFPAHLITKNQARDLYFGRADDGWKLPKNTGLDFNLATTGSFAVDVGYSVIEDVNLT